MTVLWAAPAVAWCLVAWAAWYSSRGRKPRARRAEAQRELDAAWDELARNEVEIEFLQSQWRSA